MSFSNATINLLNKALKQLKSANISNDQWILSGGTALNYYYNHRESKDIDIFFQDLQLITYVSPRINDANENDLLLYSEQTNFIKLNFDIGDVDFIYSKQITNLSPNIINIAGNKIYIDQPLEIIAKKIFHRSNNIAVRDLFDIAFVYTKANDNLIELTSLTEKIKEINEKIANNRSDYIENLNGINYLKEGFTIRSQEIEIFEQFYNDIITMSEN